MGKLHFGFIAIASFATACGGKSSESPPVAPDCALEACTGDTAWVVELDYVEEGHPPPTIQGLVATPYGGAVGSVAINYGAATIGGREVEQGQAYFSIAPSGTVDWIAVDPSRPGGLDATASYAAHGRDGLLIRGRGRREWMHLPEDADIPSGTYLSLWEKGKPRWTRFYDEDWSHVAASRAGAIAVTAGRGSEKDGCESPVIAAMDPKGDVLWRQCLTGANGRLSVSVDDSGRVSAVGTAGSRETPVWGAVTSADFGEGPKDVSPNNLAVAQWSAGGDLELFEVVDGEFGGPFGIDTAPDGSIWVSGYLVAGVTAIGGVSHAIDGPQQPFVARFDPDGVDTFASFPDVHPDDSKMGGVDSRGYAVSGGKAEFQDPLDDFRLVKLSPAGDEIWRQEVEVCFSLCEAFFVSTAKNGAVVLGGEGMTSDGASAIVKLAP